MARIYFYKLTTDDGGAPCVQDGLLSLAICKPMIRGTAEVGQKGSEYITYAEIDARWLADDKMGGSKARPAPAKPRFGGVLFVRAWWWFESCQSCPYTTREYPTGNKGGGALGPHGGQTVRRIRA